MKSKIRIYLFVLSFIFIGIGMYREETAKVLIKAINICLECIGVG